MNDLEDRLQSALHEVRDQAGPHPFTGPGLRRKARVRTLRARTGGAAVVGAAAVAGAVVAPSLISTLGSRSAVGVGSSASPTTRSAADAQKVADAKTHGTDPAGKAEPATSFTGKRSPSAAAGSTETKLPLSAQTWNPAGALIDDPTVQSVAPQAAATDQDWKSWGGQLLDQSTVSVVFADREPIDSHGSTTPRPLVLVTGRTAPDAPLRVAALTTVAGGEDAANLQSLAVDAMTTVPAGGAQAIAVSNGLYLYVAAEAGVDSATYTYRDATGLHTASMKVAGGVATAPVPSADLKKTGNAEVTGITATSHGKVVWDAAPVRGR